MKSVRMILAVALALAVGALGVWSPRADAQAQTIKIGLLYDHSGPFSAAGSLNCYRGAKMIIDYVNEKGGVLGKYKIVQVDGDSQSKAEAAINEAERLLNVDKVDILAGVYSSAHAVPLAEKVDRQQKFLWITTAIADAVLKDRNLQYTFRPQPNGSLFGEATVQYVAANAQSKLKKGIKDVRAAIIYEDGPYGAGVAASNESEARKQGMNVVLKEGFSAQAPDLSSLVTKLRAARPDVIFHTGYNPDIALFLRQAKGQGLRMKIYVGHGAGHSQLAKLREAFLNDVVPRAIQKHGGFGPEALAAAARETDIPEGGTMQGYGVKFHPAGHPMAGQNMRAFAAVFQVVDGEFKHVYPPVIASLTNPPVLLPTSSPFLSR